MVSPITELNPVVLEGKDCCAGGAGLGVLLQGSNPSSYMELARGFSFTKLAPNPFVEDVPYGCAGRGALNIISS